MRRHVLEHVRLEEDERSADIGYLGGETETAGGGDDRAMLDGPPPRHERSRNLESVVASGQIARCSNNPNGVPYEPASWPSLVHVKNDTTITAVEEPGDGPDKVKHHIGRSMNVVGDRFDAVKIAIHEHGATWNRVGESWEDQASNAKRGAAGIEGGVAAEVANDGEEELFVRVVA